MQHAGPGSALNALGWPLRALGAIHERTVHSRRVRVLAGHFADMIPEGHSVLDVGCGDGLLDILLLARRPDLKISGVDVLVRPNAYIPVEPYDGGRLPFDDRSWDTVMLCDVLHHAERPLELLREAARVGRHCVVIKDHSLEGWLAWPTLRFMDFVGNTSHGVALPYNYFTARQWEDAYHQCHLVSTQVRTRLESYPRWADMVFGRSLHFIGAYDICPEAR